MNKYSDAEISKELASLKGWQMKNGYLTKTFTFKDFSEAFGFMGRVALISERIEHHPDWNGVYNVVSIRLKTHDVDGITDKDFSFAHLVEKLFH
ncbi:MAG: 4a-hydroxytetrahydrobiopterin dehydratase [Saprospiraceae bacterium]